MPVSLPPLRAATLLVLSLALASPARAQVVTRNMQLLAHLDEYPPPIGQRGYSSCWSYIHSDGREYALIGITNGLAIYNVTNPAQTYRVAFIPGPTSTWHEMKSYRDWIYAVSENPNPPNPGLQIIRMKDPEHPVLVSMYTTNFQTAHTVSIDTTRALLVCNGTRTWTGQSGYAAGMRILSIANPEAPVELSSWPPGGGIVPDSQYVHDSVIDGNVLYGSSVYVGIVRAFDVSNPAAPIPLEQWHYKGGFTHNSWPDASGRWLYVTDEVKGEPLKIFDLAGPGPPRLANTITSNPEGVTHNAYVRGAELYLASYVDGTRVLDLSDPAHPAEFAWADTWPGSSYPFYSVWNVCPYFPSGTVIASDMQTGLYVYRPVRNYGILRVRVIDAGNQSPIAGVHVTIASADSLVTPADGVVQFAPDPGSRTVVARAFGYPIASAVRTVTVGSRDTVTLALSPRPRLALAGHVKNARGGAVADAEVAFTDTPALATSDATGAYTMTDVPADDYKLAVDRPGFIPLRHAVRIAPGASPLDVTLVPAATWDPLETESGWTVGDATDDATSGVWTRVAPIGTGMPGSEASSRTPRAAVTRALPSPRIESCRDCGMACGAEGCGCGCVGTGPMFTPSGVQPAADRTPGTGSMCFVTGQGTTPDVPWDGNVDRGATTLTSPDLDVAAMADPAIGWWRWFHTDGDGNDWLVTRVSNDAGATWTTVDTLRGQHNRWESRFFRVRDHVTSSSRVRVRFVANDGGASSLVEAAIDDVITFDLATPAVGIAEPAAPRDLAFRPPTPNPARATVRLELEVPAAGRVEVEVVDLAGRRVRTLHRGSAPAGRMSLSWDGRDESGRVASAGLYFVRAASGPSSAETRIVRLD
jgi:choice-of-anchor B domain-containing protein